MNFSDKNMHWRRVARLLLGAALVLYIFSRFIPCASDNDYPVIDNLDNSWTQALHAAFVNQLQFGTDIVFTYGPWGFLARGYHPQTHVSAVTAWAILAAIFIGAGWQLARYFSKNRLLAGIWMAAFTVVTSLPLGEEINVRLIAWATLLLFLHFFVEGRVVTVWQILLAATLGWMSLIKFTGFVDGLLVVSIIAMDNIFWQRRFPWVAFSWGAGFLFFWAAAGQHLNSLIPFLHHSWQVTSGYTEAMMLTGVNETRYLICFLVIAFCECALVGRFARLRIQNWGFLPLAGMTVLLLIVFKLGYVRDGWQHESTSALVLVLIALACLAITRFQEKWISIAALSVLAFSLLFAACVFDQSLPGNGLVRQIGRTFRPENVFAVFAVLPTDYLQNEYKNNLANEQREISLPKVTGSVDLYSYEQIYLFANALDYQPRPVLQSYSAYTPELAELNAAHLRGAHAATTIFFAIQPLDGRYPSLDDGRSWPELLSRYDLKTNSDAAQKFLMLTRAAAPRKFRQTLLANVTARFGENVTVPSVTNSLIWVEIELKKTLSGILASAFYKPPVVSLTVLSRDQSPRRFRLVPGITSGGFLLSPLIENNRAFAALTTADGRQSLADLAIDRLTISAETGSGSTACYQSPIQIRFYRLDFPSPPPEIHP